MPQPTKQELEAQKKALDDEIVAMLESFSTPEWNALPAGIKASKRVKWKQMADESSALYDRIQAAEG